MIGKLFNTATKIVSKTIQTGIDLITNPIETTQSITSTLVQKGIDNALFIDKARLLEFVSNQLQEGIDIDEILEYVEKNVDDFIEL